MDRKKPGAEAETAGQNPGHTGQFPGQPGQQRNPGKLGKNGIAAGKLLWYKCRPQRIGKHPGWLDATATVARRRASHHTYPP